MSCKKELIRQTLRCPYTRNGHRCVKKASHSGSGSFHLADRRVDSDGYATYLVWRAYSNNPLDSTSQYNDTRDGIYELDISELYLIEE